MTHALSVSGVHPSLSEIDTSAAQREGYSCCCVVTSLIARSRNYNVYRFDFFIVPVSQVIESLANSGRFIFNFIEMFYNPKKRHSHTGGVSPAKFEQAYFSELETV